MILLMISFLLFGAEPVVYVSPALPISAAACRELARSWVKVQLSEALAEGRFDHGAWVVSYRCQPVKLGHEV